MRVVTTQWLSICIALVAFTVVVIVRGPDVMALVECAVVCFSVVHGVKVAGELEAVECHMAEAEEWRRRWQELEAAVIDHVRLSQANG